MGGRHCRDPTAAGAPTTTGTSATIGASNSGSTPQAGPPSADGVQNLHGNQHRPEQCIHDDGRPLNSRHPLDVALLGTGGLRHKSRRRRHKSASTSAGIPARKATAMATSPAGATATAPAAAAHGLHQVRPLHELLLRLGIQEDRRLHNGRCLHDDRLRRDHRRLQLRLHAAGRHACNTSTATGAATSSASTTMGAPATAGTSSTWHSRTLR